MLLDLIFVCLNRDYLYVFIVDHLVNNAGIAHNFMFEDAFDSIGMSQIWVSISTLELISTFCRC